MINGYRADGKTPVVVPYEDYLAVCMKLAKARNDTIEEVARDLEQKFTLPFGKVTIQSFAAYIRGLKT